ncbi:MAG: hypothetical protein ACPGCV_08340, partial [Bacteroidia bacterium]
MRRREKRKKGIIWWFTSAALLLMVGGMYVGLWPSQENNTSAVQKNTSNPGASVQSESYNPSSLNKRSLDAEEQNITNPTPESQVPTLADNEPKNLRLGHVLMAVAGFWGGFIQIGMGFVVLPIMHRVIGLSLVDTNILKV